MRGERAGQKEKPSRFRAWTLKPRFLGRHEDRPHRL